LGQTDQHALCCLAPSDAPENRHGHARGSRARPAARRGYDPVHWGVPEGSYASDPDGPARVREFRAMVQALHGRGLRVVLDVVYNHTFHSARDGARPTLPYPNPGLRLAPARPPGPGCCVPWRALHCPTPGSPFCAGRRVALAGKQALQVANGPATRVAGRHPGRLGRSASVRQHDRECRRSIGTILCARSMKARTRLP